MPATPQLNLTPLIKATETLERALNQPMNEYIRDAAIQRFEYTYELCWKFMRRHLSFSEGASAIESLTRKELFRLAAEKTLIDDAEKWFTYHYGRNETSHGYDEKKAQEVFEIAKLFIIDAKKLLVSLQKYYVKS